VEEVIHLVRTGGFVDRALDGANARLEVAQRALDILPPSEARQVLSSLGDYLVTRVQAAR
jgi:geranylgeranyl pyrophosphate synthase